MNLRKVLQEMKDKIEQDRDQKDYQIQMQNEVHEYEQFSLRRFFEKVLEGEFSVQEIYEEAAKRSLDLSAGCYNLLFLYLQEKNRKSFRPGYGEVRTEAGRYTPLFPSESSVHFVPVEREQLRSTCPGRCRRS